MWINTPIFWNAPLKNTPFSGEYTNPGSLGKPLFEKSSEKESDVPTAGAKLLEIMEDTFSGLKANKDMYGDRPELQEAAGSTCERFKTLIDLQNENIASHQNTVFALANSLIREYNSGQVIKENDEALLPFLNSLDRVPKVLDQLEREYSKQCEMRSYLVEKRTEFNLYPDEKTKNADMTALQSYQIAIGMIKEKITKLRQEISALLSHLLKQLENQNTPKDKQDASNVHKIELKLYSKQTQKQIHELKVSLAS